jgi:putative acyl-CoA dehydrogenase
MQRVLADMALDVAAATALSLRLARAFDEAADDRGEAAFARAMTPVVKYWVCKIAPALLYEAMECLGGNGYVEEGRWRAFTARRRSTRSGKARAMSWRWTCCAC